MGYVVKVATAAKYVKLAHRTMDSVFGSDLS